MSNDQDQRIVADIIPAAGGYLAQAAVDGKTVNAVGADLTELTRNLLAAVNPLRPTGAPRLKVVEITLAEMDEEEMKTWRAEAAMSFRVPPVPMPTINL